MARGKVVYYDRPNRDQPRREGPLDFMLAFLKWQKENPERRVTPKGFAIIRKEQEKNSR